MKILITGGAGSVGTAFINKYYTNYNFYNFSRNETQVAELKRNFPKVKSFIGDICNLEHLTNVFEKIKPDVVIHAAALKHVNLAEENPTKTVEVNINGSLNVIKASIRAQLPITIGVSTDKACSPDNVYGYTKRMMERMFLEHYNKKTKFVCVRFANVANSNGSVIPFWKNLAKESKPLKLTDPKMNRLMFSIESSAKLIHTAYQYVLSINEPFILSNIMKNVNMLDLAKVISNDIEIIGSRPGEKLNETLVSQKELPYTKVNKKHVFIYDNIKDKRYNLNKPHSSLTAEDMSLMELKNLIK